MFKQYLGWKFWMELNNSLKSCEKIEQWSTQMLKSVQDSGSAKLDFFLFLAYIWNAWIIRKYTWMNIAAFSKETFIDIFCKRWWQSSEWILSAYMGISTSVIKPTGEFSRMVCRNFFSSFWKWNLWLMPWWKSAAYQSEIS